MPSLNFQSSAFILKIKRITLFVTSCLSMRREKDEPFVLKLSSVSICPTRTKQVWIISAQELKFSEHYK